MAQTLIDAALRELTQPYAVYGHCVGALVGSSSFDGCSRPASPRISRLFVCGSRPPHRRPRAAGLSRLPEAELVKKLRSIGGTPGELLNCPELREIVSPALRADFDRVDPPDRKDANCGKDGYGNHS